MTDKEFIEGVAIRLNDCAQRLCNVCEFHLQPPPACRDSLIRQIGMEMRKRYEGGKE